MRRYFTPHKIKTFGDSMLPYFLDGDVLYIKRLSFKAVKTNDVITFSKNKHFITHRVIYKAPTHVVTRGDNNHKSDGKIYPKQIIGKVSNVKRGDDEFDPEEIYLLQSTIYFQEIVKIKKLFEKSKIDYVFLKGLPLHLFFEKKHPRRIYADCDLLIHIEDREKIDRILKKSHYTVVENSLTKFHQFLKDKETQQSYFREVNGIYVVFDIHTELIFTITQLGSLNALYSKHLIAAITKEAFQNTHSVRINNQHFTFFSPEFQILFLCHHLFRDNFIGTHKYELLKKIILYYDKRHQLDWTLLLALSQKYKLDPILYACFLLLNKYYSQVVPDSVLEGISLSKKDKRRIVFRIRKINIFNSSSRIKTGIIRFRNQYDYSPYPSFKKILVFIQPKVAFTILWIVYGRLLAKTKNELNF